MENSENPKSNSGDHKVPKINLYITLSLWFGPVMVYLLLIIFVVAWPKVMDAFGLQHFVDYVTYDLQLDAHHLIGTFPRCPPELEVYFFYMQAASMLIIGSLSAFAFLFVLLLTLNFKELFYNPHIKKRKFIFFELPLAMCFFLYSLYLLFEGPKGFGKSGCGALLFKYIVGWIALYWLNLFFMYVACSYFVTRKLSNCGKTHNKSLGKTGGSDGHGE